MIRLQNGCDWISLSCQKQLQHLYCRHSLSAQQTMKIKRQVILFMIQLCGAYQLPGVLWLRLFCIVQSTENTECLESILGTACSHPHLNKIIKSYCRKFCLSLPVSHHGTRISKTLELCACQIWRSLLYNLWKSEMVCFSVTCNAPVAWSTVPFV